MPDRRFPVPSAHRSGPQAACVARRRRIPAALPAGLVLLVAAALAGFSPAGRAAPAAQFDDAMLRGAHAVRAGGAEAARLDAELARLEATSVTDRLVVRFHAGTPGAHVASVGPTTGAAREAAVQAATRAFARLGVGARPLRVNAFGAQVVQLDRAMSVAEARRLSRELMAGDWTIAMAEPDLRLQPFATASDPMYAQQWDYFEPTGGLNLPGAWDLSTGSGVVVAVIDTGIRPHPDLVDNLVDGYDFVTSSSAANDGDGRDADPTDAGDGRNAGFCGGGTAAANSSWHGTHVAGTIAAVANNGIGVAGIAYGAKVMPVRALGRCGGYMSDISDAIVWASGGSVPGVTGSATPARVLNLSLGGGGACSSTMQAAVTGARARGAVVVVAAGNSHADARNFTPANCAGVLSVAATTRGGGRAPYSNYGPSVTLAAPGGSMGSATDPNGILSTLNDGTRGPGNDIYAYYQGTSMAAPHVAGVAALMMARDSSLTGDEVISLLRASAHALPKGCDGCGAGLIDATKAVTNVMLGGSASTVIDEAEPNPSRVQPQALDSLPVKIHATMGSKTDVDTFRFAVPPKATVKVRLLPNPSSVYSLTIKGATGNLLATKTGAVGRPETLLFTGTNVNASTWYVQVMYVSGSAGPNARYTLEILQP